MPKRSNSFQRLVHYLYESLAPTGAHVTESALLKNSEGEEREIDVLIEHDLLDVPVRFAIECSDRRRKADSPWIEGLIGKYSKLPVHTVFAVSRSGFYKPAARLARSHQHPQIEIRTLEEALEEDWPSQFFKIGIATTTTTPTLRAFSIDADPPIQEQMMPDNQVRSSSGLAERLDSVIRTVFDQKIVPALRAFLSEHFLEVYKSLADCGKVLLSKHSIEPKDLHLIDSSGVPHHIKKITFEVSGTTRLAMVPVERHLIEKACVTSGIVDLPEVQTPLEIRVVQIEGRSKGKLFYEPTSKDRWLRSTR